MTGVFVQNLIDRVTSMSSVPLDNSKLPGTMSKTFSKKWLEMVMQMGGVPEPYNPRAVREAQIPRKRLLESCGPHILKNGCVKRPRPFMECPTLAANRKAHVGYRLLDVRRTQTFYFVSMIVFQENG